MLVASESAVKTHGLKPMARILGLATAGVEPRIMGIGPVPAVRKLLEKQGIRIDDIDVIELNEAFAAQGLAVLRELGIADDDSRVNPNGGAIALGHPLGMSGARLLMTAAHQLHHIGGRYVLLCEMLRKVDFRDQLRESSVPLQLIGGSDELATPPDTIRALADVSSAAKPIILDQTGHMPSVECPDILTEILFRSPS